MHYRKLGKTGLTVSEIGFGAWAIGGPAGAAGTPLGWGKTNDDESLGAIRQTRATNVTYRIRLKNTVSVPSSFTATSALPLTRIEGKVPHFSKTGE